MKVEGRSSAIAASIIRCLWPPTLIAALIDFLSPSHLEKTSWIPFKVQNSLYMRLPERVKVSQILLDVGVDNYWYTKHVEQIKSSSLFST